MFDQLAKALMRAPVTEPVVDRRVISRAMPTLINHKGQPVTWFDPHDPKLGEIIADYHQRTKNRQIQRYICVVWRVNDGLATVFPSAGVAAERLGIPSVLQVRTAMRNPYLPVQGYQFAAYMDGMAMDTPPIPAGGRLRPVMLEARNLKTNERRFFTNFLTAVASIRASEAMVRVAVACKAVITTDSGDWEIKAATMASLKKHKPTWEPKDYQVSVSATEDYSQCVRTMQYGFSSDHMLKSDSNATATYRRLMKCVQ